MPVQLPPALTQPCPAPPPLNENPSLADLVMNLKHTLDAWGLCAALHMRLIEHLEGDTHDE